MRDKMTVWVWHCDKPQGGYMFHGNPNAGYEYHFGNITDIITGTELVCAYTKRDLIELHDMEKWNCNHPKFRVKPVRVTVAMERVRKAKGGAK